jgi:asparagine synthase (glutamine-hydrolysing)
VLKEAVRDLLPHHLLHRRKKGFGIPLDRWFREDLRPFADGMLNTTATRVFDHLDRDAVRAMLTEHRSGGRNHGHALWTLLTLEVFLRQEGW